MDKGVAFCSSSSDCSGSLSQSAIEVLFLAKTTNPKILSADESQNPFGRFIFRMELLLGFGDTGDKIGLGNFGIASWIFVIFD